jgi:FixJ family two-component response regulator
MSDNQQVICIVDDDDAVVRARATAWPAAISSDVHVSAGFSRSAVEIDADVCCLIVDVHARHLGLELQAAAGGSRPRCRRLRDGRRRRELRCRAFSDGAIAFLQKPFADVELLQAVEQAAAPSRHGAPRRLKCREEDAVATRTIARPLAAIRR